MSALSNFIEAEFNPKVATINHYSNADNKIKTSIVMMTPEMASALLSRNESNRNLRKYWVGELASAIKSGEWKLTHQGVAISKSGRLLDGQHRLQAIVSAGIAVPITLSENCDEESFAYIDKGVKRSIGDSLGITNKVAEIIKFLIMLDGSRSDRPGMALRFYESELGDCASRLYRNCGVTRRVASSAPVKAAATLVMIESGRRKDVIENYKDFVLVNYNRMTPALLQFERQISTGLAKSDNKWDTFCRSYKCFSLFNTKISVLKIGTTEQDEILHNARTIISDIINDNSGY